MCVHLPSNDKVPSNVCAVVHFSLPPGERFTTAHTLEGTLFKEGRCTHIIRSNSYFIYQERLLLSPTTPTATESWSAVLKSESPHTVQKKMDWTSANNLHAPLLLLNLLHTVMCDCDPALPPQPLWRKDNLEVRGGTEGPDGPDYVSHCCNACKQAAALWRSRQPAT